MCHVFQSVLRNHPNILPSLGYSEYPDAVRTSVLSPLCRNGNMIEFLERHPCADKTKLVTRPSCPESATGVHGLPFAYGVPKVSNVFEAVGFLHRSGFTH